MKNLKNRAIYFEIETAIEQKLDFEDKIRSVRIISNWAAEQLGYDIHEAEAYARSHIANIVRENEVAKMITRIENDLVNNNIEINSELLFENTDNLLNSLSQHVKKS